MMPDFRFAAVGGREAQRTNWHDFAMSEGWLEFLEGEWQPVRGVSIVPFNDDGGNQRWDVRLSEAKLTSDQKGERDHPTREVDGNPVRIIGSDIRDRFKANGAASTRLTERKRNGSVYETGNLVTRTWQDVILIGDEDDGDWPTALIEHTWASVDRVTRA